MIKIGDQFYRNLEEQVQKNKEDIAAHYNVDRVLADFGIRIIGQVSTAEGLPDPDTFVGDYGDAYAIGNEPPYSFYIWTRADEDAGHPNDYWLDIGQLAIVGPQGPQGIQGPQGPTGVSSIIYTGSSAPESGTGYRIGDVWILVDRNSSFNGNIYRYDATGWSLKGNIIGPQGIQGPVGPQGPQGPQGPRGLQGPQGPARNAVTILGVLENTDQLPAPATVERDGAYLIPISAGATSYNVYVITGTTTLQWQNLGTFNFGTIVTEGGEVVNNFNADNYYKLPTDGEKFYTVCGFGDEEPELFIFGVDAEEDVMVQRERYGHIRLPNSTTYPPKRDQAISKRYLDSILEETEDTIYISPSNNLPKQYFNAAAEGYRDVSAWAYGAENINGADIIVHFPSGQGNITFRDSTAESEILYGFDWTSPDNEGNYSKFAVITVRADNGNIRVRFRSGDGTVDAEVANVPMDGRKIKYALYDSALVPGETYLEEVIPFHNTVFTGTDIIYP